MARRGAQGASWSARAINYLARSDKVVKAARVAAGTLVTVDVGTGSYAVGEGAQRVIVEGDSWGYLEAGAGAFRVVGGFMGARELQQSGDRFRRTAQNLTEQMALEEARGGAGQKIMDGLNDPAFKGMEKWQHVHVNSDGSKTVIHYVRDPRTGDLLDFKFK